MRNIPRDRVRMHVCWGNYEGPHDCDVPLENLASAQLNVGGFVLPFANPRHAHEFRYLKYPLGDDQVIVAGVIDTLTNFVEHPEAVADRLDASLQWSATRAGTRRDRLRFRHLGRDGPGGG